MYILANSQCIVIGRANSEIIRSSIVVELNLDRSISCDSKVGIDIQIKVYCHLFANIAKNLKLSSIVVDSILQCLQNCCEYILANLGNT